jgi:hypothetical protein
MRLRRRSTPIAVVGGVTGFRVGDGLAYDFDGEPYPDGSGYYDGYIGVVVSIDAFSDPRGHFWAEVLPPWAISSTKRLRLDAHRCVPARAQRARMLNVG